MRLELTTDTSQTRYPLRHAALSHVNVNRYIHI